MKKTFFALTLTVLLFTLINIIPPKNAEAQSTCSATNCLACGNSGSACASVPNSACHITGNASIGTDCAPNPAGFITYCDPNAVGTDVLVGCVWEDLNANNRKDSADRLVGPARQNPKYTKSSPSNLVHYQALGWWGFSRHNYLDCHGYFQGLWQYGTNPGACAIWDQSDHPLTVAGVSGFGKKDAIQQAIGIWHGNFTFDNDTYIFRTYGDFSHPRRLLIDGVLVGGESGGAFVEKVMTAGVHKITVEYAQDIDASLGFTIFKMQPTLEIGSNQASTSVGQTASFTALYDLDGTTKFDNPHYVSKLPQNVSTSSTWTSSDSTIASSLGAGRFLIKKAGTVTITASYLSKTSTITFTIGSAICSISTCGGCASQAVCPASTCSWTGSACIIKPPPTPPSPPGGPIISTKFSIGQRVKTTANLNVRFTPIATGAVLGTQPLGALGTVLYGGIKGSNLFWWNVNYDSGADGWSAEDYLISAAGTTPPPAPPPGTAPLPPKPCIPVASIGAGNTAINSYLTLITGLIHSYLNRVGSASGGTGGAAGVPCPPSPAPAPAPAPQPPPGGSPPPGGGAACTSTNCAACLIQVACQTWSASCNWTGSACVARTAPAPLRLAAPTCSIPTSQPTCLTQFIPSDKLFPQPAGLTVGDQTGYENTAAGARPYYLRLEGRSLPPGTIATSHTGIGFSRGDNPLYLHCSNLDITPRTPPIWTLVAEDRNGDLGGYDWYWYTVSVPDSVTDGIRQCLRR